MVVDPTAVDEERLAADLFAAHPDAARAAVIGVDEVGRGALAGPVLVGAFALIVHRRADGSARAQVLPDGIRDSKQLTAKRRAAVSAALRADEDLIWATGSAAAVEIDEVGIGAALGVAARRALESVGRRLEETDAQLPIAGIILDGNLDFVTDGLGPVPVLVRVKADQDCVSAAAASVLAKVERDSLMEALDRTAPAYAWASNKGYGSAAHRAAIAEHGLHPEHRSTWKLA
ncbi:ribonuclease HII [Helcobacillus massiliensis]|uniref:Ribonuclease n=1 Tax=Helcobacillus massiliensis TaxID=521392 RepID=A0A839QMQ2_9MICO|nr:ribonuclease HII [Helcobacillus massiliensis]MBB3021763.1 ribonuclease HII [Helcobacillus massiliensis]MCT2036531.1 ribonuclease HII [Helcobacillus massiliensis]WOO93287.1 ribonuclease HII [Helcobacillus massiliensis]